MEITKEDVQKFIEKNPDAFAEFSLTIMLGIVVGHMKETMREEEIRAAFEAAVLS